MEWNADGMPSELLLIIRRVIIYLAQCECHGMEWNADGIIRIRTGLFLIKRVLST